MPLPEERAYNPDQTELKFILQSLQGALASNPRLTVDTHELDHGTRRVFRDYVFSGLEVQLILKNEDFDEIVVESRTSPEDERDPSWVRVDLRNHAEAADIHRSLEYKIEKDISYAGESFGQTRYSINKRLPTFDRNDAVMGDTNAMSDEEAELATFVNEQVRMITPNDMATLGRLTKTLSE